MTNQVASFDPSVNYYEQLGVEASASPERIKRAYRDIAKACHPDSTGGDLSSAERFKQAAAAYAVVGDPAVRDAYDRARRDVDDSGGILSEFHRIFSSMDSGRRSRVTPESGQTRTRPGRQGAESRRAGQDDLSRLRDIFGEFFGDDAPVGSSVGSSASGPRAASRPVNRSVDRASDGTPVCVVGRDVTSDVRISLEDAMFGGSCKVSTLHGSSTIKIPPGTSGGRRFRLRGMGIARDDRLERGDHYVTVHVDVPTGATAEAAIARILDRLRSGDGRAT